MNWLEISVQCDGEAAEAVSELFNRFNNVKGEAWGGAVVDVGGYDALGEQPQPVVVVKTYLPSQPAYEPRRRQIEEGLWFLGRLYPMPEPVIRELAEQDWATAWQVHYQPLRVGQRLYIVPAWLAAEQAVDPSLLPIILDPGMAFGTGLHPSTRLCLAALERHLHPGEAVLDVGCGSGILSIAAARLGAGPILATDVDPVAVLATVENGERNGLAARIVARQGSLPDPAERPGGWAVIVANILAEVIVQLLDEGLARLLAPAGRLILSGIVTQRVSYVEEALARHGLRLLDKAEESEWYGLVAGWQ